MKNYIIFLISFTFVLACSKEKEEDRKITLTGKISTTKSTNSSNITEATHVVVFNLNNEYEISEIKDGRFSVQVNRDNPVGLIFTNENKSFLGYFVLHNGFESIPLNFVNDSIATIDFGTLQDSANIAKPITTDYLNNFDMDVETRDAYIQASINFSIIIHNPDADKNGIIDILEGKFYTISYLFFVTGGTFNQQQVNTYQSMNVKEYRILFTTIDNTVPDEIYFQVGNYNFSSEGKKLLEGNKTIYFSNLLSTPVQGSCIIKYGNKSLYFELPDPITSLNKRVFIKPAFTFQNNKLVKVNWEYFAGSDIQVVLKNSQNIIFKVMMSVDDVNHVRLYDSPNYNANIKEHILSSSIDFQNIGTIYIGYYDIFGNNLAISYLKEGLN